MACERRLLAPDHFKNPFNILKIKEPRDLKIETVIEHPTESEPESLFEFLLFLFIIRTRVEVSSFRSMSFSIEN